GQHQIRHPRTSEGKVAPHSATWLKKVAPGTRRANYRCSLPGLAGFISLASPRAIDLIAFFCGGERGIRTLHTFRLRFPIAPLRPFGVTAASARHLAAYVLARSVTAKSGCSLRRCGRAPRSASAAAASLDGETGGERGIRTLGTFRYTRFPIVPLRPLGHLSL